MTLNFLPWQIFLLIIFGLGIPFIIWSIRSVNEYPKTLIWGLVLLGIGVMLTGVGKAVVNIHGLEQYEPLVFKLAMLCGIPAIPLLLIGGYNNVKDDPEKKLVTQIGIGLTLFGLAIIAAVGLTCI